ncbi:class 1 alpha-mannosidase 1a [Drepanopeziza brunnea f. sp. 'multigermtubi' MB_m1]|uniref:alpha-1,2-Mannosidase n=1 Tax=Marssonina brunnea f. sp. multigermtubi (strain MB_m1) TaxID=1072389 RepID=K1XP28_MARBU|nr:class 1 alpha-mannosidase 1a [Drepanopeziza brunnea f. sp. 'multigermtubi' MB_m1]EKD14224.1 class 1 alpha-mannosidase 1a [Drepanopeziza brunnea f. sp. 'multigermtubi' MB_m1]
MPRLRRYRVFVLFAVIFIFLVVHVRRTSNLLDPAHVQDFDSPSQHDAHEHDHIQVSPDKEAQNEPMKESLQPKAASKQEPIVELASRPAAPAEAPALKPDEDLPDPQSIPPTKVRGDDVVDEIHAVSPPGRQELSSLPPEHQVTIHWERQKEHFPVPPGSVIKLPTGVPVKIPKIQHVFNDETTDAKINREKRQTKVKEEFMKAWTGYKSKAWLHDELSPVSGKFRDPFCGWAATLVDSLDTLWIMGLHDEFEEATKAVDSIDFTTSPRRDIPMFETTIRYLGGLLAAYDVSEGKYKNLLDKAVELAEVLIGAFDTPNRMPVLFYNWMPAYASQPHRASTRSNLAELGSLSMEFTRLAQLTEEPKYYDAIARVTNALSEWQDRGTRLPGVFPENVDASGCNKTWSTKPQLPVANPITKKKRTDVSDLPADINAAREEVGARVGEWDCKPQGLESQSEFGLEKFSMSGGQDSTYEYFPKQYLLLGGLDETYSKMYLKTVEAIRKWMLYRPMTPDNRDILFAGSVTATKDPEKVPKLTAEADHLTCFIGGMVGMGAKIFGIDDDLELAKKLTDGCVWAYETTESGIMPEGIIVLPCPSTDQCTWNETKYWEFLDPMGATRDQNVANYDRKKKEADAANAATMAEQAELEETPELLSPSTGAETLKENGPASLQKRQTSPEDPNAPATAPKVQLTDAEEKSKKFYDEKSKEAELELESMAKTAGHGAEKPLVDAEVSPSAVVPASIPAPEAEILRDPLRPMNHKEYVANRILQERIPPGFVSFKSKKYILRPEAIESVWYMYRITGDPSWQDKGWKMFEAIIKATSTEHGHSAIYDVSAKVPAKSDEMESFWLAETLKYFYLLYSTPDTISLDEWVLNTEAHPFKRPTA